ncbi:YfcL family protein [Colwellia sp. E2M01]|uniref:YfcL family protein n=1 Tax=Colwellia sp. E2M01 TaxID=2841561 RepID=UPI001C0855BC|nr:YfcL family protein [Colwellia sp. E2M01]MBU2872346.1 YfcL family protein [Colwellia sp. E2M01]
MSNNSATPTQVPSNNLLNTPADIYQHLDGLFDQDSDSDTLFAGGYIRGIFSLVATDFGDESQLLSSELCTEVTQKISLAKSELSPQDFAIVTNFWLQLQTKIALEN